MNVKEFKIHVMRGLMRPEYFYIPLIYKSKESLPVRFRIIDEFGDDVFISKLVLYYQIYSFNHDINQYDTYAKGYTFNADADWRYPVPDPSGYEVPIPDFTNINVKVKNGIAEKSGTTITVTFEIPRSLIEIENLPAGIYSARVDAPSYIKNTKYYPNYYDEYYNIPPGVDIETLPRFDPNLEWHTGDYIINNGQVFVCQYDYHPGDSISGDLFKRYNEDRRPYDTDRGLIDRHGNFSGFYYQSVYENSQQIGYNFYGITKKFDDNTMPIVMYYKTWQLNINKTTEYGKRLKNIKFRLHSESGDFTSSNPSLVYASVISRNSTDIVFKTTSDRYATFVRYLPVNKNYTLTELEIPENFTGYSGDIGFHYEKTGELVCDVQNEYVSNTADSITVKNKRISHRVKMVIAFVDNPLLPGGYQREWTKTGLVPHDVDSYYWGHWWEYDSSEIPEDSYSGFNQVFLYDSVSQKVIEERECARIAVAKLYLDGEYKGFFTDMEMIKYDEPTYSMKLGGVRGDEFFADNWYSIGGKNKYKGMKGTYTAWCLTQPHYWDEHAFDEESHTAVYFQKEASPQILTNNSRVGEDMQRHVPFGRTFRNETIREDPVISEYTGNISSHTAETISEELISVGDIEYEGGTHSGNVPIVYDHIEEVRDFLAPEKSTREVVRREDFISGFDIGSIDGYIRYAETHDLTEVVPTTYDDNGEILQQGHTITKYYGEGLTSDITSLMYQIVKEEDMEVVLEA